MIYDPDHVNRTANTDNGGGCFDLKCPFLKFHQVFGKDLEFAHCHPEFGVSRLLFGIELKLVQMEIRFFTHGHETTVFKCQAQPCVWTAFDLVV